MKESLAGKDRPSDGARGTISVEYGLFITTAAGAAWAYQRAASAAVNLLRSKRWLKSQTTNC